MSASGTEWDEDAHARDPGGRFVSGGNRWYVDQRLDEHARQHVSEQKAIELAAATVATWKSDSNEWRGTLSDRDKRLATAADHAAAIVRIEALERAGLVRAENERVTAIAETRRKDEMERRISRQQWVVGIGLAAASLFINAFVWFATRH